MAEKAPCSLDELARITGKAKSNLSRTLRTMEGYGLVGSNVASAGGSRSKVLHDRAEKPPPKTSSIRSLMAMTLMTGFLASSSQIWLQIFCSNGGRMRVGLL
jgi:hypothetical protein